jgi:hypothetical protein
LHVRMRGRSLLLHVSKFYTTLRGVGSFCGGGQPRSPRQDSAKIHEGFLVPPTPWTITIAWTKSPRTLRRALTLLELSPTLPALRFLSICRPLPPNCSVSQPTSTVVRVTVRPAIASVTVFRIATPQSSSSAQSSVTRPSHIRAEPRSPCREPSRRGANTVVCQLVV